MKGSIDKKKIGDSSLPCHVRMVEKILQEGRDRRITNYNYLRTRGHRGLPSIFNFPVFYRLYLQRDKKCFHFL